MTEIEKSASEICHVLYVIYKKRLQGVSTPTPRPQPLLFLTHVLSSYLRVKFLSSNVISSPLKHN